MPNAFDILQKLSDQPSRSLLEKCLYFTIGLSKKKRELYTTHSPAAHLLFVVVVVVVVVVVDITHLTSSIIAEQMEPHKLSKKPDLVDFWHETPIPNIFKTDLVLYILQE